MVEIILSEEQVKAVEYNQPKAYSIKGIAGSGKTTVGINRIPFLLKKCTNDDDKILVVTFHKTLVNYLEHLVSEQLIEFRGKLNFNQSNWSKKIKVISIDDLMDDYYEKYRVKNIVKYPKLPLEVSKLKEISDLFNKTIKIISLKYPKFSFLNLSNIDFLLEEVQYLISNRIDTEQNYQGYTRKGRNRFKLRNINLQKKSEVRKIIFELRNKFVQLQLNSGIIDRSFKRRLALIQIIEFPPKNITHLVIDEAQDLDRVQFDFLKQFPCEKEEASATFLYDPSQSIHPNSWLGNGNTFKDLGIDVKGKSRKLTKNFRTTYEIQDAAISVLKDDESEFIRKELTNKSNAKPFVIPTIGKLEQSKMVINILKTLTSYEDFKDIIIASNSIESLKYINQVLKLENIANIIISPRDKSFGLNKVRLMTLKATKGLECKAIILIDINEDAIPQPNASEISKSRDRKLLYVAMTRATKYLYIISSDSMSPFINEIDNDKVSLLNYDSILPFTPVGDPTVRIIIKNIFIKIERLFEKSKIFESTNPKTAKEWESICDTIESIKFKLKDIEEEINGVSNSMQKDSLISKEMNEIIVGLRKFIDDKQRVLRKRLINPINNTLIEENLREIYPNFSEQSIGTLARLKYSITKEIISGEAAGKLNWGSEILNFSQILESEFKVFFKINNWEIKKRIAKGRLVNLTFKELIDKLRLEEEISVETNEKLKRFRHLRNDVAHNNKVIPFMQLKNLYVDFSENYGIFWQIDNILN
ncbi:UvrD-helicase domain-containing protein [Polaribacter sp. AHE13PA]|uniref:UvrD-helicase domain-containing protein n=1 Tax=Polaribacter sp. AHE13PA TaxID=2745562 RepID=UPI001C4F7477|nr:UvrD-helicase domain-containing protein [Polaribacter sp. AHE13PA]QXP65782.1 UvrD-helicase domain-containing protein [Polaribacter sp. AHE13PA]